MVPSTRNAKNVLNFECTVKNVLTIVWQVEFLLLYITFWDKKNNISPGLKVKSFYSEIYTFRVKSFITMIFKKLLALHVGFYLVQVLFYFGIFILKPVANFYYTCLE